VTPDRQVVTRRITVGLIRKTADQLDRLAERTGMTSTDIVNRAITLAAFVVEQTEAGRELLVRDPTTGETAKVHLL
jgi:predicted transcriptional regulator